jgi:hypothetical protein
MSTTSTAVIIEQQPSPVRVHFRALSVQTEKPSHPADASGPERRREARYATCDAVEVSVLDVAGFQVRGVLRDVSKNGLCVELGLPVEPGARLRIVLHGRAIIFAVARYCRSTARSFQVGAAISGLYHPKGTGEPVGADLLLPSGVWRNVPVSIPGAEKCQECRDLAQAIIDDHASVGAGSSLRWQLRLPPLPDAGA